MEKKTRTRKFKIHPIEAVGFWAEIASFMICGYFIAFNLFFPAMISFITGIVLALFVGSNIYERGKRE